MRSSNSREVTGKKRKRPVTDPLAKQKLNNQDVEIQSLEAEATESPKSYNNIATLLSIASQSDTKYESKEDAILALCRIFTRLFASGQFRSTKTPTQSERLVQQWLEERYTELVTLLLEALHNKSSIDTNLPITVLMKLVQCEVCCQGYHMWAAGLFSQVSMTLLTQSSQTDEARRIFVIEYLKKYDDVRLNSLQILALVPKSPIVVEKLWLNS
jgi:U3 small nucleolar RNA-associated protein 19